MSGTPKSRMRRRDAWALEAAPMWPFCIRTAKQGWVAFSGWVDFYKGTHGASGLDWPFGGLATLETENDP